MEAVSFEDFDEINEISVRNIKKACMKHYGMSETMFCDALAGEQYLKERHFKFHASLSRRACRLLTC